MWFLPTHGRPGEVAGLITAMRQAGDVPEVAVMIDGGAGDYRETRWPAHWHVHETEERQEMTAAVNALLALYPDEPWYGLFGDHFRPLTQWSRALEKAAGDWFIAWPSDDGSSEHDIVGAPCFGGKLIRALGFICLPTTVHICPELVWRHLWWALNIGRQVKGVRFDRTWPIGDGRLGRPGFKGVDFQANDCRAWEFWHRHDAAKMVEWLRRAMQKDGIAFDGEGVADRVMAA